VCEKRLNKTSRGKPIKKYKSFAKGGVDPLDIKLKTKPYKKASKTTLNKVRLNTKCFIRFRFGAIFMQIVRK
jgi:hypothetical protein